jgi:hypothetical protein
MCLSCDCLRIRAVRLYRQGHCLDRPDVSTPTEWYTLESDFSSVHLLTLTSRHLPMLTTHTLVVVSECRPSVELQTHLSAIVSQDKMFGALDVSTFRKTIMSPNYYTKHLHTVAPADVAA